MVTIQELHVNDGTLTELKPLFALFKDSSITQTQWKTLLSPPWLSSATKRGFILKEEEKTVGVLITIESTRNINGTDIHFINLSSWAVLPENRSESLLLILEVLKESGKVITNFSASPDACLILKKFGFKDLESHIYLLPTRIIPTVLNKVNITHRNILKTLTGSHIQIYNDHQFGSCKHLLIKKKDGQYCYLIYTIARRKGIRFIQIHYLSFPALFKETLSEIKWALFKKTGVLLLLIPTRYLELAPKLSLKIKKAAPTLYKCKTTVPNEIDTLYSESVLLNLGI
jgi:hypothetical protein